MASKTQTMNPTERGQKRRRPPARAPRKTITGNSAMSKMVRVGDNIANTAISAVKNRYLGPRGISNLARDVGMLKLLINTEEKQIYTLATAQNVNNTTSLVYGIGTVAQGTSSSTRVGDSIKITRIDLNMLFQFGSGTATTIFTQIFNWYLVRYKKTPSTSGTTAFGISEFLNQDANSQYTPLSFPNPDGNQNFQLMANGQVQLEVPTTTSASSTVQKIITLSHDCNFHQEYSGSANTTITDNMCFIVVTAQNAINTGGASNCLLQSAMWYVDT
jgi:hypothetical protein